MANIDVLNIEGKKVKDLELNDNLWSIEVNSSVMHDAVILTLASLRQGTSSTKTRAEVRGGGRKPWKQKGTGRARQGSTRSVQWVGGGIAFGPKPRSYSIKMNRKERRLALRSALAEKFQEGNLIVIDNLEMKEPKTKEMLNILKNLGITEKTLIVTSELNINLTASANNLKKVGCLPVDGINVLELVNVEKLVMDEASVKRLEEVL